MMTKEEMLELANKCGALIDCDTLTGGETFINFDEDSFLAYTSAIEEKYQAQIAMLVGALKEVMAISDRKHVAWDNAKNAILAAQLTDKEKYRR